MLHPDATTAALGASQEPAPGLDTLVACHEAFLTAYQSRRWAARYTRTVARAGAAEARAVPGETGFAEAVARSLFKLMSYKDEYEVARLHAETLEPAVAEGFDGVRRVEFHMAPPLLSRPGPDGRPRKVTFGPWLLPVLKVLRHGKAVRGTPLDPFGWTVERRGERRMIADFEAEIARLCAALSPATHATACAIAALPQTVRGFGPVKHAAADRADAERRRLWAALAGDAPALQAAE